jgi:predicted DNA-binding transcriptional regulator AlpA
MTDEEFKRLPLFLKRQQVLAVTGFSKRHFYAMIKAGLLKPVKSPMLGKHQYFLKSDIAHLFDQ